MAPVERNYAELSLAEHSDEAVVLRNLIEAGVAVSTLSEHVRQHIPTGEPFWRLFHEDGKPWPDNLVDYGWRSTRTAAGVPYELRPYFASALIAAGATWRRCRGPWATHRLPPR